MYYRRNSDQYTFERLVIQMYGLGIIYFIHTTKRLLINDSTIVCNFSLYLIAIVTSK